MPGRRLIFSASVLAMICAAAPAFAQAPAPPTNLTAGDHARGDNGTRLDLKWELSPDDETNVRSYQVLKSMLRLETNNSRVSYVVQARWILRQTPKPRLVSM